MDEIISKNFELVVKSEVCIAPNQCYQVKTLIPWYVTAILLGSTFLIVKEIIK